MSLITTMLSSISTSGSVINPSGSSTDNAVVRWSGTAGTDLQDSSVIVSDADAITGVTSLTVDNLVVDGNAITASTGVLTLTPAAGSALQLDDSNCTVDGGAVDITGDLDVDNINLNGNTISATTGVLTLTPAAGSVLQLDDSNCTVDGGAVDITGDLDVDNINLDGNAITATTGVLTLTPAAGSALQLDDSNVTVDGGAVDITGDLDVDNINLNGNTISATSGALTLTPAAGSALQLDDANFTVDGGVVDISGDLDVDNINLDGNAITATTGVLTLSPAAGSALQLDDSNVTVDGGAVDITGDLDVDNINIDGNTIISTDADGNINLTPNGSGINVLANAQVTGLTASRALQTDGSKNLESSSVTTTELGYVSGVTSAIQTQIDNITSGVLFATGTLSNANITGMYAAPVEILAAQGAGKGIMVHRFFLQQEFNSAAFTGGGAVILQYNNTANGAGTQASDTFSDTIFSSGANTGQMQVGQLPISAATVYDNIGIYISNQTAAFATGDGTAIYRIWYSIIDV